MSTTDFWTDIGRIGDVNDVIEPAHAKGVHVSLRAECSTPAPARGADILPAARLREGKVCDDLCVSNATSLGPGIPRGRWGHRYPDL